MITYIELWKAKSTWNDLSKEERENYTNGLGPAIQKLLDNGVQIISWGANDTATVKKVGYDYFAVWSFPSEDAAREFEKMVESVGWHNYFDQVNASGMTTSPQEVIGQMIQAEALAV
ncbi:DUF6616 family protein [Flavisolibacter tropicus]|uniref:NIPSNAP domain-containing protein n=1 Tax=Flavisolibacter tropicus TaxID=1492898 RepID=A0A172U0V9_9BACT|nr:DUF6616 family protein [Flavisolibacter tropicus]ANE52663.1 hypothetical protein SY85_21445 [Flavisolibacter tropicus]